MLSLRTLGAVAGASLLAVAACTGPAAAPSETAAPATTSPTLASTPAATSVPTAGATPAAAIRPGTVDAPREVRVEMGNFSFEPATIRVKLGETVRLVFHNPTTLPHEALIGDRAAQEAHEAEMHAGMGHGTEEPGHDDGHGDDHDDGHHAELPLVSVEPGATANLTLTIEHADALLIGCHLEGHYLAGMVAELVVES